MKQVWKLATVLAVGLWAAPPGWAAEPVAIVEDVSSDKAQVEFMDYLEAGRIIDLPGGASITIGYLRSCWRETITGGQITVGTEKSSVEGGRVQREQVECDGGRFRLTKEQAAKGGVTVFRKPRDAPSSSLPQPELTIFSTSPLISLAGGGRVLIERLDRPGETHEIVVTGNHEDLAISKKELIPGGLYRIRAGRKAMVFMVDPFALPGGGPIISRLIRF